MTKHLSAAEFEVALGELGSAIGTVGAESDEIAGKLADIGRAFVGAESSWESPSAATFAQTQQWFTRSANDLHDLLAEMVRRMRVAHQNYLDVERQNAANVTAKSPGGSAPHGPGGGTRTAVPTSGNKKPLGSGSGADPAAGQRIRPANDSAAASVIPQKDRAGGNA